MVSEDNGLNWNSMILADTHFTGPRLVCQHTDCRTVLSCLFVSQPSSPRVASAIRTPVKGRPAGRCWTNSMSYMSRHHGPAPCRNWA